MEAIRSSVTSVHARSTRRHIPEDGILHFSLSHMSSLRKKFENSFTGNPLVCVEVYTARVFSRDSPGKVAQWTGRPIRESWGVLWLVIRSLSVRTDVSSSVRSILPCTERLCCIPLHTCSMLELSPPLPIILLLRVAGLSGLNTIIVLSLFIFYGYWFQTLVGTWKYDFMHAVRQFHVTTRVNATFATWRSCLFAAGIGCNFGRQGYL
jgi:hypothetical protein